MLKKQIKVLITDCNHPLIEIERKMLSEIMPNLYYQIVIQKKIL